MRLKTCGLTRKEQVLQLDELGVEFAGFIFYPKSPRYVGKYMSHEQIKKIKGKINKVGVFVNAPQEEVLRTVDECGLYLVQLHGDETPKYCEKISEYITVIKSFPCTTPGELLWRIQDYHNVVDMFLFDTPTNNFGGSGKKFNWNAMANLDISKPFFLSGGININDVEAIRHFSEMPVAKDLFSLDINSRFETGPGVKDIKKIEEFCRALKIGRFKDPKTNP